jgi:hypothetical protein
MADLAVNNPTVRVIRDYLGANLEQVPRFFGGVSL